MSHAVNLRLAVIPPTTSKARNSEKNLDSLFLRGPDRKGPVGMFMRHAVEEVNMSKSGVTSSITSLAGLYETIQVYLRRLTL